MRDATPARTLLPYHPRQGYSPIAHWFIRDLESGKIEIPAEDFPASLYNQSEADPDDVEKGLLPLLFKAFNAMFFGKSSVYTGSDGSRGAGTSCNSRGNRNLVRPRAPLFPITMNVTFCC
ncbi:hypothetical protein D9757_011150 [Collybiopsis confluens]|uniref:Uncharacterized protein n=1 Tax=Collybiopsis confluens TaxID=2823264 RepID=A0A8H5M2F3_9AGAR|nr:hypothetical protein D9757_011150 [Collybiopsis confluens]